MSDEISCFYCANEITYKLKKTIEYLLNYIVVVTVSLKNRMYRF